MRQAREKRCLAPTGMVESLHGEEFSVDGVVRLIQHGAHRRHLRVCEHRKQCVYGEYAERYLAGWLCSPDNRWFQVLSPLPHVMIIFRNNVALPFSGWVHY
jgi:hypothetical protein